MKRTGTLDGYETRIRLLLTIGLALIAWYSGWSVVGAGALVLALVAAATAASGISPTDRVLARIGKP